MSCVDAPFIYAGLDFILDQQGQWRFLEANDHPVAICHADELERGGAHSIFSCEGVDYLARELIKISGDAPVCLLLPDCFKLPEPHFTKEKVVLKDLQDLEGRIKQSLDDFNMLLKAVSRFGHACYISDALGVAVKDCYVHLSNGVKVGALYRRSYDFPKVKTLTACANDLRYRYVCPNKSLTYEIIKSKVPHANPVPTYSMRDIDSLYDFVLHAEAEGLLIIEKPISGAGSRNVKRVSPKSLIDRDGGLTCKQGYIYQPWISPSTIQKNGFKYFVDYRVYLVSGKPIAGCARQAAGPTSGPTSNTAISWLTTTGPLLPITSQMKKGSSAIISAIEDKQLFDLFQISKDVCTALEEYVSKLEYASTCETLTSFAKQLDINSEVRFVSLVSNP